jgi:Transposase DDE domain group 1
MDANAALTGIADSLDESRWARLDRKAPYENETGQTRTRREDHKGRIVKEKGYLNLELNYEDVAEFDYRPGKCKRAYKVVALRKNISRSKGEQALLDEVRYLFYVTSYTDKTPAQIVELANERCDQENVIGDLKSGIGALRVPLYDLVSNWAYMVIAALAWNLKSWFALMMHRKADRRAYIRMEFRTFFNSVILLPAMVIRRARAIIVRLVGYTSGLDRLFNAWNTIEQLRFG